MFGARAAAAEVGPPPLAPQPYRVFISYSHRADAALAEALAATLTRFARPWWVPRAMKVFLDKNSMASDVSLEWSIRNGLARCEWLLLLACPESANSPWVREEVAWWVAHRPLARLIIAHTGGTIAWQGIGGGDFDWAATDALPAGPLRRRFAREPLWADLRAAVAAKRQRLSDADYRAGFLTVAARIHGVSKDALWNLERGEQRVRVTVAIAALLAIVAFVLVARNQRRISDERDENIDSIALGAKALRVLPADPMLAAQIALAGMRPRASGTAANAFRAAVAALAGPTAPRFETQVPGAVTLAWSSQAARLAVADRRGAVTLLDAADGRVLARLVPPAPFEPAAIAWGAAGTLAVAAADGLRVWPEADRAQGEAAPPPLRIDAPARALAFAPDGQRLAIGEAGGAVRIVSVADGATRQRFTAHPGGVGAIAFGTGGDTVATASPRGEVVLWQAATGQALLRAAFTRPIVGLDFNRDGSSALAKWSLAATDADGALHLIDVDPDRWHRPAQPPSTVTLDAAGAAPGVPARFSASGRCLARAAADGSIAVVTVFDEQRLLTLQPGAAASAPLLALDTAQTRRFASLDAAGRIAAYEQPLCGDAEAVCAFARGRLARGPAPERWRRWIPKAFDLKAAVRQPPKPGGACEALINDVLTPP